MTRTFSWMVVMAVTVTAAVVAAGPLKPAPNVVLSLDTGSTIPLSQLKGTVVLVDFWASWCVPCRRSFPALDSLQRHLCDKGLKVIAVNVDEQRRDADQFLANRPHTMAIAFDPRGSAAEAFSLKGMPSSVLIDRRGNIRYTHMGYTEKTLEQFKTELDLLLGES